MSFRSSLARHLLAALVVLLPAVPAHAQSTHGGVVGVLTDTTKAVVPGATVTLREVQTSVIATAWT